MVHTLSHTAGSSIKMPALPTSKSMPTRPAFAVRGSAAPPIAPTASPKTPTAVTPAHVRRRPTRAARGQPARPAPAVRTEKSAAFRKRMAAPPRGAAPCSGRGLPGPLARMRVRRIRDQRRVRLAIRRLSVRVRGWPCVRASLTTWAVRPTCRGASRPLPAWRPTGLSSHNGPGIRGMRVSLGGRTQHARHSFRPP